MNRKNPKVDAFLDRAQAWQAEMKKLRTILLACPLTEELKWGKPCYTFQDGNVAILQPFKESCALMFFKGALLKDDRGILVRQGEHSQSVRRIQFTGVREIADLAPVLKTYVMQAIEVEKAGLKVQLKTIAEHAIPEEFQRTLDAMPALKAAFEKLTPGRQRAYLLYFSSAKQSSTREGRIEKCMPQILKGKGLND